MGDGGKCIAVANNDTRVACCNLQQVSATHRACHHNLTLLQMQVSNIQLGGV